MKLVEIEWYDALSLKEYWWEDDEIECLVNIGPQVMKTSGYLVKKTKKYVLLCQTRAMPRSGGYFLIPTGSIISIKNIHKY